MSVAERELKPNAYIKIRGEVLAGGATAEADEPVGGARAVLGIGVILALLVALAVFSPWAFVFVVGLLISIFLHECGHYITARRSGMKVTQFFMGMGPKLWSFRRGEIEYGVRAFPVGAFVRIVGMNNLDDIGEDEDESRTYRSQSYPRRMITICAGSIMHMLIAIVLLFTVYATWGQQAPSGRIELAAVVADSGAAQAGLQKGDQIVSIDGVAVNNIDDVSPQIVKHHAGDSVTLVVQRDDALLTVAATLHASPDDPTKAFLGVQTDEPAVFKGMALTSAFTDSFSNLGRAAWDSVGGVIKVMNPVNIFQHLTGQNNDPNTQPATVVGISRYSSGFGQQYGLPGILLLLAGVNVFVGLLNMVPLLPFDGGHAAIATYERIRSRKGKRYQADVGKMVPVAMAVMTFLVFVLFTGLYLDITHPVK